MGLREEIASYIDSNGQLSWARGVASNNGLLYSSLYLILLKRRGELRPEDLAWWRGVLASCEVEPGNYRRNLGCGDLEAIDDYVGITAAASVLGEHDIAARVLALGLRPSQLWGPFKLRWVFNWIRPGTVLDRDGSRNLSCWLGRVVGFRAHLYWAAGKRPPLLYRLVWGLTIALSGSASNQDAWLMSWLCLQAAGGGVAAWVWRKRLARIQPTGMRGVMAKALEASHPLATYWV